MSLNTIALVAFGILIFLMFMRSGVDSEDLALYLASGFLFEIVPTMFSGFIMTCIHYITFAPNAGLRNDIEFINAMFFGEIFINGVFALLPMILAVFMLRKSAGIGFIATVGLSYYAYYLACL